MAYTHYVLYLSMTIFHFVEFNISFLISGPILLGIGVIDHKPIS